MLQIFMGALLVIIIGGIGYFAQKCWKEDQKLEQDENDN